MIDSDSHDEELSSSEQEIALRRRIAELEAEARELRPLKDENTMLRHSLEEALRRAKRGEELYAENEVLQQLATVDPLTLVSNQNAFNAEMELFKSMFQRGLIGGTLVYADLDDFKAFNDKFSRAVGDEVLRKVASIMRHSVRPDDMVARIGGDEFAILLKNAGLDKAREIMSRVDAAICAIELELVPEEKVAIFLKLTGRKTTVSASFGFCEATKECNRKEMLLARAEANVAKYEGRRI